MSTNDYLLSLLSVYGAPALSLVLLFGCIGLPMPASLMLMAAGSFAEQGELSLWQVIGMAIAASVMGDNIGYAIGRWGGHRLISRMSRWIGGQSKIRRAEDWTNRWGGIGIFFTRWLLTPLGPLVNLTSGITQYSWPRFLLFDVAGEALWVLLYVVLGKVFSNRVQAMSEVFGDVSWLIVGLVITFVLGWKLMSYLRTPSSLPARDLDSSIS